MRDKNIKHGFVNHSGSKQAKDTQIKPITESEIVNSILFLLQDNELTAFEVADIAKCDLAKTGYALTYLIKANLVKIVTWRKCKVANFKTRSFTATFRTKTKANHSTEKVRLYQYLQHNTATATMVHKAIDIDQKNICRYKRYYEKRGLLWEVKRTHCKVTGVKAWYLTTDADLAEHLKLV